ncbi:Got1-like family protein [Xylariaceae sp. FL1651]|nr:Got1-like family protein [Xylariaceae sp. FL1651]
MPTMWLSDNQSKGPNSAPRVDVHTCKDKRLGSLGGLILGTLQRLESSSAQAVGGFFLIGGVLLFFDRAMLAMGNSSFHIAPEYPNEFLSITKTHAVSRPPTSPKRLARRKRDILTPVAPSKQILFLIGLTIIIGPQKTLLFFARRQKAKGTAAFFAGLLLILLRWPLIGFFVELYGIVILFGDFLGTIAGFARNIPIIGPYIGLLVDRIGLGRRNAELPV